MEEKLSYFLYLVLQPNTLLETCRAAQLSKRDVDDT
jgi:hypothetical protein